MKRKVLVVQPIHERALDLLRDRDDVSFKVVTDFSEENLIKHVVDAEAITVRDAPLGRRVIKAAKRLKVVSRHGVGYDNIPVKLCSELGIPVTIVGPVNAVSVAEHTIYLMLAAARQGMLLDAAVRKGDFSARDRVTAVELRGKTLLLVGFGRIGREVAKRAATFDMNIKVFDPFCGDRSGIEVDFVDTLETGLSDADVVSLHAPLNDGTRRIIGARELAILPRRSIVVNASRGGLLDEAALMAAVASGKLHGAALDTFDREPLSENSPLTREPRIVLSPHCAALSEEALISMGVKTVENVLAVLDGEPIADLIVNGERVEA
ncbi:MAG: hydroxyacid dehydrogenase [Paracoccaceae bacterium]|nr:hydroxyacid dehydrogenase [Paracoccaceae bacterium]